MLFFLPVFLLVWSVCASNTDLLSVLQAQPSLIKFTSLISANPALLAAAQVGGRTIIAPNDQAFTNFFATPSSAGNYSSPDQLYALLQYHILNGTHSSNSITSTPTFIPSILTNLSYTNVTTGQVVEAVTNQTAVTFRSGVHQVSTIVEPNADIVFIGGFIHIVDAVMLPPLNGFATATAYPLTYFLEDLGILLSGELNPIVTDITNSPNQTFFGTNSKALADSVENNTQATNADYVMGYFNYSNIPGEIVYSTALTNGSKWPTRGGMVDLTITELNGDIYVNNAKIIIRDVLIANGVLHVIDGILNASDPNAHPQWNTTASNATAAPASSHTTSGEPGLSTGAKAGIGIGAAIGILSLIVLGVFLARKRQARKSGNGYRTKDMLEVGSNNLHETDNNWSHHEMNTRPYDAAELDVHRPQYELNGETSSHHPISPVD